MRIRGFWGVVDWYWYCYSCCFLVLFSFLSFFSSLCHGSCIIVSWSGFFSHFVWLVAALHGGWEWGDRRGLSWVYWLGFGMGG
jgi:hypothetical protein